jgi:hypothetical protein
MLVILKKVIFSLKWKVKNMSDTPTLSEVLQKSIDQVLANVHTCLPGKIETYDDATGLASVQPLLKRKYTGEDESIELPVISGVPVVFSRTANAYLKLPVAAGDNVMLLFAERSIDKWLTKGGVVEPGDPAKFSLNDAIAVPGLYPKADAIQANGDQSSVELANKTSYIEIKASGEIIVTDGSLTLTVGSGEIKLNATKIVLESANVNLGDEAGSTLALKSDLALLTVPGALGGGPGLPVSAAATVGTIKTKAS